MLFTDALFWFPAYKAIHQQLALAKNPQYSYIFKYRGTFSTSYLFSGSTADYGVAHGDDVLYLFPYASYMSGLDGTMSDLDYEIVDTMVKLWTSFARDG